MALPSKEFDPLTDHVIGLAIEVHKGLGPGLLESVYERCLCMELDAAKVPFARQVPGRVTYKGAVMDGGFRMDIVVQDQLIVELKAVEALLPAHSAQLLTYMRLSGIRTGLLLNFNVSRLSEGLRRLVL